MYDIIYVYVLLPAFKNKQTKRYTFIRLFATLSWQKNSNLTKYKIKLISLHCNDKQVTSINKLIDKASSSMIIKKVPLVLPQLS